MAFAAISARHENLVSDAVGKGQIGHFRVQLSLHFKARLRAKSLLWKSVFIHIEIATNYHNKNFALGLALKERLRGTRKWSITIPRVNVWLLYQGGNPVRLGSKPLGANEATHPLLNRSIKEELYKVTARESVLGALWWMGWSVVPAECECHLRRKSYL